MNSSDFSPTHRAMLKVLADGQPHALEELHACLPDEKGSKKNVSVHLSAIRKQLRMNGQDIVCEWVRRQRKYRWIRLLKVGSPMPAGPV